MAQPLGVQIGSSGSEAAFATTSGRWKAVLVTSVAEQQLLAELMDGVERLKREIGYNPTYFTGMVVEHGPVEACRRLIRARNPSDGFTTLWENGRMEMSVEAISLLPWYAQLFDAEDLRLARQRLMGFRFDLDAFLRRRTALPPAWLARQHHEHDVGQQQ